MAGLRRLFLTFSISLITAVSLSALENPIEKYLSVQLTPQFEIANGTIKEYVFYSECKNTDNKLSELDWHLSTLALFNIDVKFDVIKYINLGINASFGVPQRSDFMQDYDWQNSTGGSTGKHLDWKNEDPTENTDFSEHINHLDKYITFKVSLGGNLYLPLEFKITPNISYYYEYIKFTGSNGYGRYKEHNYSTINYIDNVIAYQQEINSFLLGINICNTFIPRTYININFDISPNLTFLNAIDFHYPASSQIQGITYNNDKGLSGSVQRNFTNTIRCKSSILFY